MLQEDVDLHWKNKENQADVVFCMEHLPVRRLSTGVYPGLYVLKDKVIYELFTHWLAVML